MTNNISELLRERLEGENLSALTKRLKLPNGLLHRICREGRNPSLSNIPALVTLCDYLGMTLQELLTGSTGPKLITSLSFTDDGKTYLVKIEKK